MNDWSDEEFSDNEELVQPSRDMPPEEEDNEEEEDGYDMNEIIQMTLNNKNVSDDFFKKEEKKPKLEEKPKNISKIQQNKILLNTEKKPVKRQFQPRLPPPK